MLLFKSNVDDDDNDDDDDSNDDEDDIDGYNDNDKMYPKTSLPRKPSFKSDFVGKLSLKVFLLGLE